MSQYWRTVVVFLMVTTAGLMPTSSKAQDVPEGPRQRPPEPIAPPHKPVQQGFRFAATIGLDFIANGKYRYNTAVTMPDGRALVYSGVQRASGGTLYAGVAATPRGAVRRMKLGC